MEVYFRLNGGLGNQLSQYAAAKYYSNKYGIDISFDDYYIVNSKKKHEKIILKNLFKNTCTINNFRSILSRFINRLLYKFRFKSISILSYKFIFDNFYYDKSIDKNCIIVVEGFWQNNYIYSHEVSNDILNSVITTLGIEESKILDFKHNHLPDTVDIALHVRRGDYLTNRSYFRRQQLVLPVKYYSNAMQEIINNYGNKIRVFIFSDDKIDLNEFKFLKNTEVYKIQKYSDLESFYLFTRFNYLIIANSTYSMWAALLSYYKFNSVVYAPNIWHRGRSGDIEIIPKDFKKIKF